jgi:DNA polymerase-1
LEPIVASSPAASSNSPGVPNLAGKSIWAVDAHSLIFQVFHAIPEMTSPRGQAVNAVYGFTRDVLFLLDKRPDYFFCAFDMSGYTFRHDFYADYKKDRKEMPDDLPQQIELIHQVLAALSVPVLGLEGYEADDVLATIARIADEQGADCYLVSGDKDCRQLISDHVKVYNVRKNIAFDAVALEAEWGIRPEQVIDFQALVGDSIDSVPGVPGIGPTYAKQLLQQFGTLEAVLDRATEVTRPKLRQNLIDFREQALMSQRLVRLDRHVPIAIDWPRGLVKEFNVAPAVDIFVELGFRGFAEKVRTQLKGEVGHVSNVPSPVPPAVGLAARMPEQAEPTEGPRRSRKPSESQRSVRGLSAPEAGAVREWKADYRAVTSLGELTLLAAKLAQQSQIAIDIETTHHWPRWAELVGIAVACCEGEAYYIPLRAPAGEPTLDQKTVLDVLRPVLENPSIEKVGQNLKYEIVVLRSAGVNLAGPRFDALVASYLVDAGQRRHGLDELSKRYLNHDVIKISELIGTGKKQKRLDEVPLEQITRYAAEDADVPLRLRPILERLLEKDQLSELYDSLEAPLIDVLADLEYTGIRIDQPCLAQLSEQFSTSLRELEMEIYRLAGREFNIASPKQLQEVLFRELKLPTRKRTSTSGPSTDAAVLEDLAMHHELPAKILEFRQYAKLKGTYVDALPQLIHPQTGRVHTSFNQDVAATGRLSSSDPNLQNIPIRTEQGRAIRSAFLPEPGWKLLAADYSQIELRILAHFSGDEALRGAFARDEDIHTRVASEVYSVPPEAVTSEMRRKAKAVNFGIVYGQSPFGLAKQLRIDPDEAAEFIEAYYARYRGVEDFLARTLAECAANGYVSTIMGRRRAIHGVRPGARRQRNLPERTAVNTVIQGSAADLIKRAMIAVHRRLNHERFVARMLLQIHDELLFEVPPDEVRRLAEMVEHEMSTCLPLAVPIKVDVAVGDNWAQVEPVWSTRSAS